MSADPTTAGTGGGKTYLNYIRQIEQKTTRKLSIETRPTPESLAKCHGQSQSPLFGKLPPEIRNHIFSLALLQYEDCSRPYPKHDYCYRPGHTARHKVSVGLLRTCRLAWLEANHLPMAQAVHSFWFDEGRRPPWVEEEEVDCDGEPYSEEDRIINFFESLTAIQRSRVKHVHIFAQMYWLEDSVVSSPIWKCLKLEPLTLDTFTITIRHSDWWGWESESRLRLQYTWMWELLSSPEATRISNFRLELETLEHKVDQVRPIVEALKSVGKVEEGPERWEVVEPCEETTWSGPTNLGGEDEDEDGYSIYDGLDELGYRVITIQWRRKSPTEIEQRWQGEGTLLKLVEPPRTAYRDAYCDSDEPDDESIDVEDDEDDEED